MKFMRRSIFIFLIIFVLPVPVFSDEIISDKELTERTTKFFNVADRACYFKMKETASFGKDAIGYFRWENRPASMNPVLKKDFHKVFVNEDMYVFKIPYNGLEQKMESWQETESYCYFDFKDMDVVKIVVR